MSNAAVIGLLNRIWEQLKGVGAAVIPVSLTGSNALLQLVKTVTTAGTRVQLHAGTPCKEVLVTALFSNTGFIYVGTVAVSSAAYGKRLRPEESVRMSVSDFNLVYIDSSVNGEGVAVLAVN